MSHQNLRRSKRHRNAKQESSDDGFQSLKKVIQTRSGKLVIVTGSGASPLGTFHNGLYQRAAQQYNLSNGQAMFRYKFLEERLDDYLEFFGQLAKRAADCDTCTQTYKGLQKLQADNLLIRHYTLNVCGTAKLHGIPSVELHGTLGEMVCRSCGTTVVSATPPLACTNCGATRLRYRVLMYEDEEGDLIRRDHAATIRGIQQDTAMAGCAVVWVGISFEQSASCEMFRLFQRRGTRNYLVNPDASNAVFCLQTAVGSDAQVVTIPMKSDDFFRSLCLDE